MRMVSAIVIGLLVSMEAIASPQRKPSRPMPKPVARPIAALPHTIPATGDLNRDDLVAIGKFASLDADQFSDDPSMKYVGRQFVVLVPSLSTEYNKDTKQLKVSTPQYEDGFILSDDESRSEYVGQNSYGAKTTVTKVRGYIYGVAYPGERYNRKVVTYDSVLESGEARDLSKSLKLRITGTIIPADGIYAKKGSVFFEHPIISDATVSDPYDTFIRRYYIAARFIKAEWIDSRTGAIVKTDQISQ